MRPSTPSRSPSTPFRSPSTPFRSPSTIGARLERQRIEHRARRVRLVLAALQDRAVLRAHHGVVPPALHEAISGFHAELRALNRRLADHR